MSRLELEGPGIEGLRWRQTGVESAAGRPGARPACAGAFQKELAEYLRNTHRTAGWLPSVFPLSSKMLLTVAVEQLRQSQPRQDQCCGHASAQKPL